MTRRASVDKQAPPGPGDAERYRRLLDAAVALSSELSLAVVLQRIVALAAEVTGARYAALGVLAPDARRIEDFITHGLSTEERAAIGPPPAGLGLLGALIDDPRPVRLPDIALDPRSVGFPPRHPPMRSFLGAPLRGRHRVLGNLYLTDKQGAPEFTANDEEALVLLAAQAAAALENARLFDESERRAQRLEAFRLIATGLLGGASLQTVLGIVASRARELAAASVASVLLPEGAGQRETLSVVVSDGPLAETLVEASLFRDDPLHTQVVAGRTVRLDTGPPSLGPGAERLGPTLLVPIKAAEGTPGAIVIARDAGQAPFGAESVELAESFGEQAALAVAYDFSAQQLRRLAVLDDRERIAKELHDGVIQALFAVGMNLQAAAALSGDPTLAARLESAVGDLDDVIRDLRNYIFGLRPGALADRQLDQALRQLAAEFEERTGITTIADLDPAVGAELASKAADVVQIVREALSNVGRHSAAKTCRVGLWRHEGAAVLEVDDDGTGFPVLKPRRQGLGLGNLRDRAAALAASLDISSSPDDGTTVRVTIPL